MLGSLVVPVDRDGEAYVLFNPELSRDSRMRELSTREWLLVWYLATAAAESGRSGWVPIEDGETAADTVVRINVPSRDEPRLSPVRAQAALDRFERLGLIAVEPGRIRMTAPELFSYEEDPAQVHLLDYRRFDREWESEEDGG